MVHLVRRFTAAQALGGLRATTDIVEPGSVGAVTARLSAVPDLFRLVTCQIVDADAQVDRLTDRTAEVAGARGQDVERREVTILRSSPEIGGVAVTSLAGASASSLRRNR